MKKILYVANLEDIYIHVYITYSYFRIKYVCKAILKSKIFQWEIHWTGLISELQWHKIELSSRKKWMNKLSNTTYFVKIIKTLEKDLVTHNNISIMVEWEKSGQKLLKNEWASTY